MHEELHMGGGGPTGPALAGPGYDPEQRWIHLVGGGAGVIYAVQADGGLYWYRHLGSSTGVASWANGGTGRRIGSGWHELRSVLAAADGTLFGVRGDGTMVRFRYNLTNVNTGAGTWSDLEPVIGTGFGYEQAPRVFGGFDGVIYTVDTDGELFRRRWTGSGWADGGRPQRIGGGFTRMKYLMADAAGVVYGVRYFGDMVWYRHLGGGSWANGAQPIVIGHGFLEPMHKMLWCGGDGTIYAIHPDAGKVPLHDDRMLWQRLTNYTRVDRDRRAVWANGGKARVVGNGFTCERDAALQGYPQTPGVTAGETARVAVSTTFPSLTATVLRVAPGAGPTTVAGPSTVPGRLQHVQPGYRARGCGWQDGFTHPIPADWPSGLYAVRLEGNRGYRRDIPFVVRPPKPANRVAVVLPTATYNAYNGWGGHYQYSDTMNGARRTFSTLRPSYVVPITPPGTINVELYSDILLLRWMSANGIAFDLYTDADLHAGGWLGSYRALVLGSHAEYWSDAMRGNVLRYLRGGGRLVSTGGNGVHEQVRFSADLTAITYRDGRGERDVFSTYRKHPSQLLGANYLGAVWDTWAPYRVVNNHALLAGTGLRVGDDFGATGYNGQASGWETDGLIGRDGEAKRATEVIAIGTNRPGPGATMLFIEKPNGGFVFSASSMTFNGSLPYDTRMSSILRNVFHRALADGPAGPATAPEYAAVPAGG